MEQSPAELLRCNLGAPAILAMNGSELSPFRGLSRNSGPTLQQLVRFQQLGNAPLSYWWVNKFTGQFLGEDTVAHSSLICGSDLHRGRDSNHWRS